ncbi:very long chain fatty acid elongase 4-like [Tubulanus polymorphus]|uniref:very long chain fatty acid elongase 4-like n=1 Tax=Tubulanus polymorphus TaxID=672921 RepID=UPI003DA6945F
MSIFETLRDKYELMLNKSDKRFDHWLWMKSPVPTLVFLFLYIVTIYIGPKIMRNREPFHLKPVLVLYNLCLVVLSAYISIETVRIAVFKYEYNWFCQPIDYSTEDDVMRLSSMGWWFYISKIIELLDTVFFILRKKNNQISVLHCYHHGTMTIICWTGVKYFGGGSSFIYPMFNSTIHTFMYTYYGLAAMGPSMQKYLWWKKYMTKLQLLQLVGIMFFMGGGIFKDCNFPKIVNKAVIVYTLSLVVLFGNFYYRAYIAKKQVSKSKSNGLKSHQNGVAISNGIYAHNGSSSSRSSKQQNGKSKIN